MGAAGIEAEILRLSGALEEQSNEYVMCARAAAEAEVAWKVGYDKALLRVSHSPEGKGLTVPEKHATAELEVEHLLFRHTVSEAVAKAALQSCRSTMASLSAVQSVGANLRAQMELSR
jgi:hypothetical protein